MVVDSVYVRAFGGGERTGPSPVDRRKTGSKHTLLVERHGIPLAIRTAGANVSEHGQNIPIVLAFPTVGGKPGRPKELPDALYADRGYDSEATRALLAWLGIEPHIAVVAQQCAYRSKSLGENRPSTHCWATTPAYNGPPGPARRQSAFLHDSKVIVVSATTSPF